MVAVAAMDAQSAQPQGPGGLLMGVVVDSLSAKPIPGAFVTVGNERVKADADGRFVFSDLAKGSYAIEATMAGYHEGAYGRTRPDGPSATILLEADERVGNVRIKLFRQSAISGQVTDETGEPLVGASVEALLKSWVGGRPVLERAGTTVTDDRGLYRVGALGVGEFIVAAIYESMPVIKAEGDFIYPVHYYPRNTSADQAALVALAVGDDRSGVDIQLRLSAASRVRGILRAPAGPQAGPVTLTTDLQNLTAGVELEAAETTSEPNGRFEFLAVPSGSYVAKSIVRPPPVRAEDSTAPTRLMWAATPFAVDGTDVNDLDVQLRPGFRISGRLVFEGSSNVRAPRFDVLRAMSATIDSLDVDTRALGDGVALAIELSGAISSKELPPGRYFVRIDNVPAPWMLKAITANGRDLSNAPIRLDGDAAGLTFAFTDRPTALAGVVRGDTGTVEGATILVFPRNRSSWVEFGRGPLGFRSVRSSRDGTFRIAGVPPGDYFVVALDDAAASEWQRPGRLDVLAASASAVTLGDAEKRSLDLRLSVIR